MEGEAKWKRVPREKGWEEEEEEEERLYVSRCGTRQRGFTYTATVDSEEDLALSILNEITLTASSLFLSRSLDYTDRLCFPCRLSSDVGVSEAKAKERGKRRETESPQPQATPLRVPRRWQRCRILAAVARRSIDVHPHPPFHSSLSPSSSSILSLSLFLFARPQSLALSRSFHP